MPILVAHPSTAQGPSLTVTLTDAQICGQIAALLYLAAVQLGNHGPEAPPWSALSPIEQAHYRTKAECHVMALDHTIDAHAMIATAATVRAKLWRTHEDLNDLTPDALMDEAVTLAVDEYQYQLDAAWRRRVHFRDLERQLCARCDRRLVTTDDKLAGRCEACRTSLRAWHGEAR